VGTVTPDRLDVREFALDNRENRGILLSVTERGAVSRPSDLVQGTLDLLLLKILALEPLHGWAIGQRLRQVSGNVLQVSDGSLYPALHKLENEGWIKAEWKPTENNRRAKFYSLTGAGRRQLENETATWDRLSSAITQIVRIEEA
jgi:PadR family transcriptional regulator, regulatory protein PadR